MSMNIAPTCPKCLRPYWNDGSQTAVSICKCIDDTLPPPNLVIHSDTYIMQLLKEINNKLDELIAIQVQAKVKPEIAEELIEEMAEEVADTMLMFGQNIDYAGIIENWKTYFTNKLKNG